MFGGNPACLDLDESERNAPTGNSRTLTVAGVAYQRDSARGLEREISYLKASLGLKADDELKYNFDASHPSRIKAAKAGYDRKAIVLRSLEKIASWPVHVLGHVEIFGLGSRPVTRVDSYLAGVRHTVRTFASAIEPARGSSCHQVRIDYPGYDMGQDPFREYQTMYREGLQRLGFAPELSTSPAFASPFIQIADIVVGCVSEYVTDKARSIARGSAYRSPGWPTENFQLIAQKAFLPGGSLGITVSTESGPLAEALREAMILDGILAEGTVDPIMPVRIFARSRDSDHTQPAEHADAAERKRRAG